jgi:hypothetical protein
MRGRAVQSWTGPLSAAVRGRADAEQVHGGTVMMCRHQSLEDVVRTRLLRLNAAVQGVVTGLIAGFAIFIATNWLVIKGGDIVGPHLALLGQFFIGYRVTFMGSMIGFAYGFAYGFVIGYVVSSLYNRIVDLKEGRPIRSKSSGSGTARR